MAITMEVAAGQRPGEHWCFPLGNWPALARRIGPRTGPRVDPKDAPMEAIFSGYATESIPFPFREQFLRSPKEDFRVVLEGTLHRIWHRPRFLSPLFRLLARAQILLPYAGLEIPTTLEVGTGRLPDGRPFHVWDRVVSFSRPRETVRFPTKIVYDPALDEVVDLVGPRDLFYMVWFARFHPPTDLTLDTAAVAVQAGGRLWWLPRWLWRWTVGTVRFLQRAESVSSNRIRISIRISHPLFGDVFGYDGTFQTRRVPKETEMGG
jgi:hypothetical protein